jgi:hypothetical protein
VRLPSTEWYAEDISHHLGNSFVQTTKNLGLDHLDIFFLNLPSELLHKWSLIYSVPASLQIRIIQQKRWNTRTLQLPKLVLLSIFQCLKLLLPCVLPPPNKIFKHQLLTSDGRHPAEEWTRFAFRKKYWYIKIHWRGLQITTCNKKMKVSAFASDSEKLIMAPRSSFGRYQQQSHLCKHKTLDILYPILLAALTFIVL